MFWTARVLFWILFGALFRKPQTYTQKTVKHNTFNWVQTSIQTTFSILIEFRRKKRKTQIFQFSSINLLTCQNVACTAYWFVFPLVFFSFLVCKGWRCMRVRKNFLTNILDLHLEKYWGFVEFFHAEFSNPQRAFNPIKTKSSASFYFKFDVFH